MKTALARSRTTLPILTARVAAELGMPDGTDKVRRWLANESQVDPVAIPVLARAVGVHPLEMLSAYGLVEPDVASLALRLAACERRFRRQRGMLAEQHRVAGGALFAETALRDGSWLAAVMPHWRGRRCRYHFADYVFLSRLDGLFDQDEAFGVFGEAFKRTGAHWDDGPFTGGPLLGLAHERVYVPRLAAARAPEPYARALDSTAGIVVAGPRWAGMYTVAALVSEALGWGRESFEFLARSLSPDGGPSVSLANELLRGWLADLLDARHLVWAHILNDPEISDGATPAGFGTTADVRLLAGAPAEVQIVLLLPTDDSSGRSALDVAASLANVSVERLRASVRQWRKVLPERPGLKHLVVPTPRGRSGAPVGPSDAEFLDGYFDGSVDVAFQVLALLSGGSPVRDLVPKPAAEMYPFAALAASA
jgi:hypothetical protein